MSRKFVNVLRKRLTAIRQKNIWGIKDWPNYSQLGGIRNEKERRKKKVQQILRQQTNHKKRYVNVLHHKLWFWCVL